jgi:RHS repeat-associated protein
MSHLLGGPARLVRLFPVLLGLSAAALATAEVMPHASGRARAETRRSLLPPGDTITVWGPQQFNGSSGQGQTYVESFTATVAAGRLYTLHLVNGNASGGQRASKVIIKLNGFEVVSQNEVTQAVAQLDRVVAITAVDTIRVTVAGSGNPFITLSVLSTPAPEFDVYGPNNYAVTSGSSTTYNQTFPAAATAGPPYRVYVTNGASDGTLRVTSASVTLNGSAIVTTSQLTSAVGSLTKTVTLLSSNTLQVVVNGSVNRFITVRFTASDTTRPVLTITTPAPGAVTNTTSIGVSGTLQDQTPVTVSVNGAAATVTNNTAYSATVPLGAEGSNLLTVTAIDAAGKRTDSTRTVIRDTQSPALAVSAPADGSATRNASVTVSGTVGDATPVTVTVNGAPFPVTGGSFSGPVTLAYGANVLTTTATDAATNSTVDVRTVTRDTLPPVLTVSSPQGGATTGTDSILVSGTVSDATTVTVSANGVNLPVSAGAFGRNVPVSPGANTVLVVATDLATNTAKVSRAVFRTGAIPPDPSTVAPALDPTVATTMAAATRFLYTGANPIQTGVAPGTISDTRVAVLKGKVTTRDGQPLSGVAVSVLDHPEFGSTYSRLDGAYDLAVNGGELLALQFTKPGHLAGQRQVEPPVQAYSRVPDLAMVPTDTAVATISFADPTQVAQGSSVTDSAGTRQATLIFKQGTEATMTLADGTVQPLGTVSVRATEYTVGPGGPAAMPGMLPPNSGYTYAAELSVDEAIAAGAKDVQFSQPVPMYVDNFLGVRVGLTVPAGYLDRTKAAWIPIPNGRVIKVLGVSAGLADLDITGDDVADPPATLAGIGINDAERERLATLYATGKTLWRIPLSHFTPVDANYSYQAAPGSQAPQNPDPKNDDSTKDPNCDKGSVIECETQTLGERIQLVGTAFSLNYRSNRTPGRAASRTLRIRLSGATISDSVKRIYREVYVAGRQFTDSFATAANLVSTFTWNGDDAYGRPVQGSQPVRVRIGYVYNGVYTEPALFEESFAAFGGVPMTSIRTRQEIVLWQEQTATLGSWDAAGAGLGGWTLSAHHAYDPVGQVLYLGDGRRRDAQNINAAVTHFAGTGTAGGSGDGGPATQAQLNAPTGVAVAPDGSVIIVERSGHRIRKVTPDGIISTIAGTGAAGYNGDNRPASGAQVNLPHTPEIGPDGSIYFGDQTNFRVRKISPAGTITTVVGNGTEGAGGDGGPATAAQLSRNPRDVLLTADGSLYVIDGNNDRIRRVSPSGIIRTIVGDGTRSYRGDGGPASAAWINLAEALAPAPDGSLWFTDRGNDRIRRVGVDGIIRTVAGTGIDGFTGDGGPGTQARVRWAQSLKFALDGSAFFSDTVACRIRRIGTDGIINTVLGNGTCGYAGDGGLATQATGRPYGLAFGPDGSLYVTDASAHRVRRISPTMPGFTNREIAIASEDGSELYQFDSLGRHLRTRDALTGATLLTFGYTASGRLSTVTDADNNVTAVERDGQGRPTGILGPFGQRTTLTVDAGGYLASASDPLGNRVRLFHRAGGILDSLADPRGYVHRYTYDAEGRLRRDDDPAGGFKTLALTETDSSWAVPVPTALGRTTTYRIDKTSLGGTRRVLTDPAGLLTTSTSTRDGRTTTTYATGLTMTATDGPDPRWAMQAPVLQSLTVQTPGGLTANVAGKRRVTLANPADPLSLATQVDSVALNGQWTVSTYTQATRELLQTSPAERQVFGRLDAKGRLTKVQTAGLDSLAITYDAQGRVSQEQVGGRIWTYAYDARSRLVRTLDPLGRRDSLIYDDADRLTRRLLPGGREVQFGYDSSGNLTSVTPPGRPAHTFGLTPVDLTSGYTPPNVGLTTPATTNEYNLDRQLTRILRPDSVEVLFGYEATSGRPSTVTFDRGQLGYSYHPTAGTLSGITAPGGLTLAYTYDGGLPKTVTWGGAVTGSIGVTYNNDFRVTAQTVNGANSLGFGYDADGLLTSAGALGIKRHAQHGLVERDSLGDLLTVMSYDPHGALASLGTSHQGSPLFQTSYVRDSLSRITELTETVQGTTTVLAFTYDSAGRLFEVRRDGQLTATYEYDLNGNRTRLTTPGGVVTGSSDAQDRLTSYGTTTYTYGSNGELKSKTVPGVGTTGYTYDALGNLTAAILPDGTALGYLIDGEHRRIGKTVNGVRVQGFLYQGQLAPVAELDGQNQVVSRFVYGTRANVPDYLIKAGVTYRVVADHLGSVRLVVNTTTGQVAQRLDYDEYGVVTQNSNPGFQPFGYAGGLLDDHTGLVRFGARDYDATTGRWTAKDPIGFGGGFANLYEYVDNDPVNHLDSSGLQTLQTGVTVNISWGPISFTGSFGTAIDARGNIAPFSSAGAGLGAGARVSGGLMVAVSNARTICDLAGPFSTASVGAGAGGDASIEFFSGPTSNGYVSGGGFTAGAGLGAGGFGGVTTTIVGPVSQLW